MLIRENQLDEWTRSHAREAQGVIVELVWRLISVSSPQPKERRFPLGDSIEQHGTDGFLNPTTPFEPFVPEGVSYWEIGTNLDAQRKATSDYRERTAKLPEETRLNSTFIFVTPRSGRRDWQEDSQKAWLRKRCKQGKWKDVRIIDGTKLIDWLAHFPSVEFWLAQKIAGINSGDIETPEQYWEALSTVGELPSLIPDLFLENREDACSKLKELFNETSSQLKLTTHYVDQVVDFVVAYLMSQDKEISVDLIGRCLIVKSEDGWHRICSNSEWKNHILVADTSLDLNGERGNKLIRLAQSAGHVVVFGGPYGGAPDSTSFPLRMPDGYQIQKALEKAGYGEERARALTQRSSGNLSSLLRVIRKSSSVPAWAERTNSSDMAIAMLVGSWNEKSEKDREVVEKLAGKPYGEWIKSMREIALEPSTPLTLQDGIWRFIPRYEGWFTLGRNIFDEHLDLLVEVVVTVLREKDPKFDLPADQRFAASIYGKTPSYSRVLRTGLAESLALLGSFPKALLSCTLGKAETTSILTARQILDDVDWILWASMNDFLPLLAEASPSEFLTAVETALEQTPSAFEELFAQERNGSALFGGNYMTGLLWALETVAWDSDYISRATLCLGQLASLDPGGQSANRPTNSLTTIFVPWFPQTTASLTKRVSAIRTILKEVPDVGWELLLSLLPEQHTFSMGARKPAWRGTIPEVWRSGVTGPEYFEQLNAYLELTVSEAKKEFSKLTELVEKIDNLPQPAFEEILDYLGSDAVTKLPETDRALLWKEIVDIVTKHRRFAHAEWAMPPSLVNKVAEVADRLSPESPFYKYQRIFTDRHLDLFEEDSDYETRTKELEKRQKAAVEEVYSSGGLKSVLSFAEAVKLPQAVGGAFGHITNLDVKEENAILPSLLNSENRALVIFVSGFIWRRYRNKGWDWVDGFVKSSWTPQQLGVFFSFLPFNFETWDRVSSFLGTNDSLYWNIVNVNPFEAEENINRAIEKLIEYNRPKAAIRCLHRIVYDKKSMDIQLAVRALFAALRSEETPDQMDVYDMEEIIKELQRSPEINEDDLFSIEWSYLPLLDGHRGVTPKILWKRLVDDPAFFCELIRLVFKSKKPEVSTPEITNERKRIATNAHRLIDTWRRPPGMKEDGSYDGDALKTWVEFVRKECTETGHLDIAFRRIGHVLFYAPGDPEGLWIHHSVAEVLNDKDSKEMRIGFRTQISNSRGFYNVDPTGKPEKELAAKCREQAEAVETVGYPRLAQTLQEVAEEYEREAERNISRSTLDD
jgi:hypothetical protein